MSGRGERWRWRGRRASLLLPFDDVMELALALLAIPPAELKAASNAAMLDRVLVALDAA